MRRHRALTALTTVLCVLGTTGALLTGAASARPMAAGAHAAAATRVVRVRPVDAKGHLRSTYHVAHRPKARAHCALGSEATGNAYRCFAGNKILDPCWAQAGATHRHAICLTAPWSHAAIQLHVRSYDNSAMVSPSRQPWGIRLANGARCAFVQGASQVVHGRRLSYFCQNSTTVLLGNPSRATAVWRIHTGRANAHGHVTPTGRKAIATAYFGRPSLQG
jgi:eukaryotic-like serine/threonine-protein kinase